MTLQSLEDYRKLPKEIQQLSRELDRLRENALQMASDVVRGSSTCFPYIQRTIRVSGLVTQNDPRIAVLEKTLQDYIDKLYTQRKEIEDWIEAIDDSQLRAILRYRYIWGYSWARTAIETNNTESAVKMRLKRADIFSI